MKYRLSILFISVIFIITAFLFYEGTFAQDTVLLGVKVSSREEISNRIEGKLLKTDVYHYPIYFNDNNLPYDWQTNTIYIPQDMNNDSFMGKLTTQYGELIFSDIVETDYSECFFTDEYTGEKNHRTDTYNDKIGKGEYIKNNALFNLFLVCDDYYVEYNVIFTGMPVISLTYNDYNPESMSWNGNMTLFDPYHKKNKYISSDCEYHLRGDSTSHADKKSYEINLSEKKSLVGMRTDDDWALIAMLGDNGFVHNKLAYELWNEISATNENPYDNTVNCEFVEVFYDNTYSGLYLLCEKIDRKQCKLTEGDYLYRLDELKSEENTLMGYEKQFDFRIKWPKDPSAEDYKIINDFEYLFYSKDGFDLEKAYEVLNLDNIIDMNLYSMLICGVDNWDANCFYIAPKSDNYRISEVMWDMNETFGDNEWFDYTVEYETSPDMMIPYVKKIYDADTKKMSSYMYTRWKELRRNVIDKEEIKDKIKVMEEYLYNSGAITRESDKWLCYLKPEWRYDNIYGFIDNRIEYLDYFFESEYINNK